MRIDTDQIRLLAESGLSIRDIGLVLEAPTGVIEHKLTTALELSDLDPRAWVHAERDQVAVLVAEGLSTPQIAAQLGLSRNQVRHHRIARSGELSRSREKGNHHELHHDHRTGSAAADQPDEDDAVKAQPIRITDLNAALDRFWQKTHVVRNKCWQWLGATNSNGYALMRLEGRVVLAHRFAYAAVRFGSTDVQMDDEVLDHVCHNRSCVNPAHLRSVSHSVNAKNWAGARKDNPLGVRGVSFNQKLGSYRARVCADGVRHELGHFDTLEEADQAAREARLQLFGEGVQTPVAS